MKSAFERAMERFGCGDLREYTPEQKEQLAEVDRVYDAKAAQARFAAKARMQAAADRQARDQVQEDLAVELASIETKREREKETLRERFGSTQ